MMRLLVKRLGVSVLDIGIIKKGIVDDFYGKLYNRLYYLCEEADYSPTLNISKTEVEELLEETENFLKILENIIKNIRN